jgi:hypothetical protein
MKSKHSEKEESKKKKKEKEKEKQEYRKKKKKKGSSKTKGKLLLNWAVPSPRGFTLSFPILGTPSRCQELPSCAARLIKIQEQTPPMHTGSTLQLESQSREGNCSRLLLPVMHQPPAEHRA